MVTAVKKTEGRQICTQETPRPQKKILLLDQMNHKHLFPLVRDREVGIATKYQHVVIQSVEIDECSTTMTTDRPPAPKCKEEWSKPWKTCTKEWTNTTALKIDPTHSKSSLPAQKNIQRKTIFNLPSFLSFFKEAISKGITSKTPIFIINRIKIFLTTAQQSFRHFPPH